ncbi:MAG: hypothetical protein BYD32DRAFT_429872 [Podila humilis]|nr:MAG: hypothetical protein BYD32DRAFT_429872 [Podila humilis]
MVNGLIKWIFRYPRPCFRDSLIHNIRGAWEEDCGFPSSHTMLMVCVATIHLIYYLTKDQSIITLIFVPVFFFFVLLTSFTRVCLGLHFLHDVSAAILVAPFVAWIGVRFEHLAGWTSTRELHPDRVPASCVVSASSSTLKPGRHRDGASRGWGPWGISSGGPRSGPSRTCLLRDDLAKVATLLVLEWAEQVAQFDVANLMVRWKKMRVMMTAAMRNARFRHTRGIRGAIVDMSVGYRGCLPLIECRRLVDLGTSVENMESLFLESLGSTGRRSVQGNQDEEKEGMK